MRSFGIFALVATAALSLFSPVVAAGHGNDHHHVDVAAAAKAHAHAQRSADLKSVPVILTTLTTNITPACNKLSKYNSGYSSRAFI